MVLVACCWKSFSYLAHYMGADIEGWWIAPVSSQAAIAFLTMSR